MTAKPYCTTHEAGACYDGCPDAYGDPNEPQEDDAFLRPYGQLGARTGVSFAGRWLGDFADDDEALDALVRAMDDAAFWPNVWRVDDHGGATLIGAGVEVC